MSQTSFEKRIEIGQAIRDSVPRASHSSVGDAKRDPIKLLKANSSGRVERLIPLRYGRMLASPFAFYRGSAILQAHDLATTPHTGLTVQICGDAHLMNFGGFATPERNLVFDMNDFDETHPGPWEWDVKRLAASITVAARSLGFKSAAADKMVFNAVENYRTCMIEFSRMGALDLWYEMTTFDELLKRSKYEEGRKAIAKAMEKAQSRTQKSLLPKMASKVKGKWQFREDPPELFHHSGENSMFGTKDPMVPPFSTDAFVQTIDPQFLDVAPEVWDWKEGDEFVPVIMPRDLFVMLNTFMDGIPIRALDSKSGS